uniref:Uncharacterized protein n=1 Tax=Meloidogyne hapla TaxID=6305 RepID=A0A1I8B5A0_MELHA
MISSLIVLLLVASISVLTTTPLIFHCCKKKEKKDNKKQAKQPEKGGGGPGLKSKEVAAKDAAGKDAAAKDGGAKPPSAEQVQKKPDDKKKTPAGKGDAKNVKPPVTYHVMKGKPTSSELAKKATATAQVAMPPTTTLPPATGTPSNTAFKDPAKQSSGGKDAVSGQKPPDGDAKNINGSKATEVKSKTNEGKFSLYYSKI